VFLTYIILPQMLARGRGAIVNISSVSSLFNPALLSMYAGAKAFIDSFSKALHAEYEPLGIDVQVQNPFFVSTKMTKQRASLTVPSPDAFVRSAVRFIGQPEAQVLPYFPHAVQAWLYTFLPENYLSKQVRAVNLRTKAKALKKKAEASKRD